MKTNETMTDFRALCAKLVELYQAEPSDYANPDVLSDWRQNWNAAIDRAHAALAQPEPQGPTVMQILALADEIEAEELGTIDLVRRALARWGRPASISE